MHFLSAQIGTFFALQHSTLDYAAKLTRPGSSSRKTRQNASTLVQDRKFMTKIVKDWKEIPLNFRENNSLIPMCNYFSTTFFLLSSAGGFPLDQGKVARL